MTGTGVPTGTVTFQDGGQSIGTITLSAGVARLTTSALANGTHSIVAVYNPSGDFNASRSATLQQIVRAGGDTWPTDLRLFARSRAGRAIGSPSPRP